MRLCLTLAAVLALAAAPLGAVEIGSVAAANTAVEGTPPGTPTRVLAVPDRLLLQERIVSSETGTAQFLFDDQTSLTIAPNTDLVLDEYVYDPDRGTGQIAMSFNRGLMRFIGGRITKATDAVVTTPVATIGIRGAIVLLNMESEDRLRIVHAAGERTTITANGKTLVLTRTNATAVVDRGGAPDYLGLIDLDRVRLLYGQLQGPGGGGARLPSEVQRAREQGTLAGLAQNLAALDAPAVSTSGANPEDVTLIARNFDVFELDPFFGTARFGQESFLAGTIIDPPSNGGGGFEPVGGDGFIRGQLIWNTTADLDLHLILPNEAGEVAFFRPTIVFNDGGATAELDFDNLGGVVNVPPSSRVENIVVSGTDIPAGRYSFFVDNFSANGNASNPFTLTVTGDGGQTLQVLRGDLTFTGQESQRLSVDSPGGQFQSRFSQR